MQKISQVMDGMRAELLARCPHKAGADCPYYSANKPCAHAALLLPCPQRERGKLSE